MFDASDGRPQEHVPGKVILDSLPSFISTDASSIVLFVVCMLGVAMGMFLLSKIE